LCGGSVVFLRVLTSIDVKTNIKWNDIITTGNALYRGREFMMLNYLQRLGKSLMLPIAMLPAAALLVRFGADDMLDIPFVNQAGSGILDNLGIIFAFGIAIGFSWYL